MHCPGKLDFSCCFWGASRAVPLRESPVLSSIWGEEVEHEDSAALPRAPAGSGNLPDGQGQKANRWQHQPDTKFDLMDSRKTLPPQDQNVSITNLSARVFPLSLKRLQSQGDPTSPTKIQILLAQQFYFKGCFGKKPLHVGTRKQVWEFSLQRWLRY